MSDTKRCENCYYGSIWQKAEERGDSCCMICLLRSNPFKGRIVLHSKDDKCRKWRANDE